MNCFLSVRATFWAGIVVSVAEVIAAGRAAPASSTDETAEGKRTKNEKPKGCGIGQCVDRESKPPQVIPTSCIHTGLYVTSSSSPERSR